METRKILAILVVGLCLMVCQAEVSDAAPMGTAFTYQGHLYDNNDVANDLYDFRFKLYDDPNIVIGQQIGSDVNVPDVDVIDGYFTVELDFGDVYDGNERWLEIGVRPGDLNDPNIYTLLSPRQEVTPTPYALYAKTAGSDNDWMISDSNMYSIPSGNVGIGTDSPAARLTVNGGILRSGSTMYGANAETHINLGIDGTTGMFGQDYSYATVGGGYWNNANNDYASVGGGYGNEANDFAATVSGGMGNIASGQSATVGGGRKNEASGSIATVGGGLKNEASGYNATVAGGGSDIPIPVRPGNIASGDYATVGGGGGSFCNTASGDYATVSGGSNNTADGLYATVPGGLDNNSIGDYSFASGRRAKANHDGSFVWGDSTNADFASTDANQFLIRASGGVGIGTDSPDAKLHIQDSVDGEFTGLKIRNTQGSGSINTSSSIELHHFNVDSPSKIVSQQEGTAGYAANLRFYTPDSGGTSNLHMTISNTGNVGIGVTIPKGKLHAATGSSSGLDGYAIFQSSAAVAYQGGALITNSTAGSGTSFKMTSSYNFTGNGISRFGYVDNDDTETFVSGPAVEFQYDGDVILVQDAGNVGIGVTDPTEDLDVAGTARLRGIGSEAGTWTILCDGTGKLFKLVSSKRYKRNIEELEIDSDAVLQLRPISFQYKSSGQQDIGLIAEEVEEQLPDLVIYNNEGRPDAVKYDKVALYLLAVVKAQQEKIAVLEESVAQNNSLKQRLGALERTMQLHQFASAKEVQQ